MTHPSTGPPLTSKPSSSSSGGGKKVNSNSSSNIISNSNNNNNYNSARLSEVLDDICMRFIVNLPGEEYETFERLFFAIEAAHWFYDDFFREQDTSLPRLPLKPFAARLFERTQLLSEYRGEVGRLISQFQAYKQEVPTCGAALLNANLDRVVLVRGWGRDARWSFPKGKLAKQETELECAMREVLEETGFDMTGYVDENTHAIDSFVGDRYARIYVVPNVPEDSHFATRTRKEISDIQWVPINVLPESARAAKLARLQQQGNNHNNTSQSQNLQNHKDSTPSYYIRGQKMLFAQHSLAPFIKRLRVWIRRQKKANAKHNSNNNNNNNNNNHHSGTTIPPQHIRRQQQHVNISNSKPSLSTSALPLPYEQSQFSATATQQQPPVLMRAPSPPAMYTVPPNNYVQHVHDQNQQIISPTPPPQPPPPSMGILPPALFPPSPQSSMPIQTPIILPSRKRAAAAAAAALTASIPTPSPTATYTHPQTQSPHQHHPTNTSMGLMNVNVNMDVNTAPSSLSMLDDNGSTARTSVTSVQMLDKSQSHPQLDPSTSTSFPSTSTSSVFTTGGKSFDPASSTSPSIHNHKTHRSIKQHNSAEIARNRATFGSPVTMTDEQRRRLFHQYVVETDRRVAASAQQEAPQTDFWPVPYVTTGDLPPEQRRDAERASAKRGLKKQGLGRGGTVSEAMKQPRKQHTSPLPLPLATTRMSPRATTVTEKVATTGTRSGGGSNSLMRKNHSNDSIPKNTAVTATAGAKHPSETSMQVHQVLHKHHQKQQRERQHREDQQQRKGNTVKSPLPPLNLKQQLKGSSGGGSTSVVSSEQLLTPTQMKMSIKEKERDKERERGIKTAAAVESKKKIVLKTNDDASTKPTTTRTSNGDATANVNAKTQNKNMSTKKRSIEETVSQHVTPMDAFVFDRNRIMATLLR